MMRYQTFMRRIHFVSIRAVFIADGFNDDCELLIQRCLQAETLSFSVFCHIWKDMEIETLYFKRTTPAEIAELSEQVIHIAKQYMVAQTSNYEETVAGLFLVYALIHTQPLGKFAPLRISPSDLKAIHCIADIARKKQRYDVVYILGSILLKGPCELHIAPKEYGLDYPVRKYYQFLTSIDRVNVNRTVFKRPNEELDLLRELSSLNMRYTKAKSLINDTQTIDRTLNYADEHFVNKLTESFKEILNGSHNTFVETSKPDEEPCSKRSIKRRAMKNTVNDIRHLKTIGDGEKQANNKGKKPAPVEKKSPKKTHTKTISPDTSSESESDIYNSDSEEEVSSEFNSSDDYDNSRTIDEFIDKITKKREENDKSFDNGDVLNSDDNSPTSSIQLENGDIASVKVVNTKTVDMPGFLYTLPVTFESGNEDTTVAESEEVMYEIVVQDDCNENVQENEVHCESRIEITLEDEKNNTKKFNRVGKKVDRSIEKVTVNTEIPVTEIEDANKTVLEKVDDSEMYEVVVVVKDNEVLNTELKIDKNKIEIKEKEKETNKNNKSKRISIENRRMSNRNKAASSSEILIQNKGPNKRPATTDKPEFPKRVKQQKDLKKTKMKQTLNKLGIIDVSGVKVDNKK